MKRTLADLTLSGRALGYAPKISMEEGIARFVAWLRAYGGARALLVRAHRGRAWEGRVGAPALSSQSDRP